MKNQKNKNLIVLILLVVCGILAGGLVYTQLPLLLGEKPQPNVISKQEAVKIGLAYINENLLPQGMKATSTGEVSEEWGLYKFKIKVGSQEIFSYITKDGKTLFPQGIDLEKATAQAEAESESKSKETTLGNFSVSQDEICLENGKPIVYFFGSQSCPHCRWEHPIFEKVAGKFGDLISFHNNMDSNKDMDVFQKYSTGGIPTLVLGCKYYRVGSGEGTSKQEEIKSLTALICDLTGGQPANVCNQ